MSIRILRPHALAVLFSCAAAFAFAQEATAPQPGGDDSKDAPDGKGSLPIESEWEGPAPTLYTKGDKTFIISLGTIIPTVFYTDSGTLENKLSIGGCGSLNYNYYFNSHFALGGEIDGMFAGTIGENMLYIVPYGVKATWHFILSPFEFPVSLMVGAASQSYLEKGYIGLFVKPGAAAYWRFNQDWSFGLNAAWWWLPQWTNESSDDVYGNFLELTLSARYHF